ncbi:Winged helix-turn-helix transcription repressor DNA-binding [Penicillium alfredii]|uniref:DNA topoisomerase (ATP-hydrolyzing) n=1 Tax=Penicillium alfredii TaxID=1506179 RepID=A0A9W9FQZ0_9EURO|nr:Winged helix-turn-helix transcription repressor DNA-binding [Penicillium alfredii]KAJ5104727.1 Winged helix-turn-helix transcription repressor DNA-binding [Penicillium alfredii]
MAFPSNPDDRESSVRAYIDHTLASLLHELSQPPSEARPAITLRRRANRTTCIINPNTKALEAQQPAETYRTYLWPGKTAYESWKFTKTDESIWHAAVVVRILSIVDQAIRSHQRISKRDIYYIDPEYFRCQSIVNGVIDELAYTIGVERAALNVVRSDLSLSSISDAETTLVTIGRPTVAGQDTLIPRVEDDDEIDMEGVRWVLVIEKEAVFHRLARNSYYMKAIAGDGILVTGKGYPDLCTRSFVRRLFDTASNSNRRPPQFYALTDGDPHGMGIMSTYKYGSAAHLHDNARLSVPGLQWLGLRVSDAIASSDSPENSPIMSLTARDRKKITAMFQNSPVWASDGPEPEWRTELQRMLMLSIKAEIEILYEQEGGLEGWIDRKMFRQG